MPENYIQIGMTKFDYVIGSKFNAAARTTRVAPQFLTKHMCFFSLVTPYNSLVIPVDIVYKRTSKRALVRVEPRYVTV